MSALTPRLPAHLAPLLLAAALLVAGCASSQPALGVAGAPGASAVAIEGSYQVQGGSEAGTYIGGARITRVGDAYTVEWNIIQGGSYTGIGLREGDTLSVAIRLDGDPTYLGVIVYQISEGPTLEGRWTVLGAAGPPLTETLLPAKPGASAQTL